MELKLLKAILENDLNIMIALRKFSDDSNIRLILGDRVMKTEALIKEMESKA